MAPLTLPADTAAAGCPSPSAVAVHVLDGIQATRSVRSRFALKLWPITYSCHASLEDMQALGKRVAQAEFPAGAVA